MAKAHKRADFSGALGAILGGIGGAATTTPDSTSVGEGGMTAGQDAANSVSGGTQLTPQMLAALGIQKPGAFANFMTGGKAQANYMNAVAPLLGQQMQGQNVLANTAAQGGQERQTLAAKGGQDRQTAAQNAAINWMSAHDIPFTPDNFQKAQSAMMDKSLAASLTGKQVQQNQTTAMANATTGKTYQGAVNTGAANEAASPMFANLSKTPTVGMGQQVFAPLPGAEYRASGAMPTGSSSMHKMQMDKNGMPITTDTTTQGFNPPSASLLPKFDLGNETEKFNGNQNSQPAGQPVSMQYPSPAGPQQPTDTVSSIINALGIGKAGSGGMNMTPTPAPSGGPSASNMLQSIYGNTNNMWGGQPAQAPTGAIAPPNQSKLTPDQIMAILGQH